jgi:hypothetical protein
MAASKDKRVRVLGSKNAVVRVLPCNKVLNSWLPPASPSNTRAVFKIRLICAGERSSADNM